MRCIYCGNNRFKKEIDLGKLYQSSFVKEDFDYKKIEKISHSVVSCKNCGFVQMPETPPQESMYKEYWYRSSLNSSMVEALKDVVNCARKYVRNGVPGNEYVEGGSILDIASNDGTSLSLYPDDWYRVGVDPAGNLSKYYTEDNCNVFINDYFTSKIHFKDKFDIITSIAVFYDLLDPRDFIVGIKQNLKRDGVWVMQMTDLLSTLKCFNFDNLCVEHIAYWTLKQFCEIVKEFDLEVFRVEYNNINGCSLRTYVQHKGARQIEDSVESSLKEELEYLTANPLKKFSKEVVFLRDKIRILFDKLNKDGMVVGGLGASTKGNTTLQYFDLNTNHIQWIGEVSSDKFGLYTVGSHIPIISEQELFDRNPPYIFVLIWQFTDFILNKHKAYLDKGGKFIVPMPELKIISKDGEEKL